MIATVLLGLIRQIGLTGCGGAPPSASATEGPKRAENVRALVFVNGFAPEEGEVLSKVESGSTDSALNPALLKFNYPTGNGTTAVELTVDPAKFSAVFAGDLPPEEVSQPDAVTDVIVKAAQAAQA